MKKALVLGVLAIFAINIATVQTAKAQDKKDKANTTTTNKNDKKVVKPAAASWDTEKDNSKAGGRSSVNQAKGTETKAQTTKKAKKDDPTQKNMMPARTSSNQAKGVETKSEKAVKTVEKKATTPSTSKTVGKESDPTKKNKTPEIGVPPTTNKTKNPKQGTANGNNGGDSK